jgi:hypothetical protein
MDSDELTPLKPRKDNSAHVVWRVVHPQKGEDARWETHDGRWISLALGSGEEIGSVVIANSEGMRRLVESYEGALALAKEWRY